jgi:hypothetical protein
MKFAIPRLFGALLLWFATAHPSLAVCLIHGAVLDAETGKPIAKTKVFAKPHENRTKPAILRTTGEDGAFCFENLEPAPYEVTAVHTGYLNVLYGALPHGEEGMVLEIDGQTEIPALTLKLLRRAAIAGTVLDATGEPREGARVKLDRKSWDNGWRPDLVDEAFTDDRGMFRFSLLPPGSYYISTMPGDADTRLFQDEKGQTIRSTEAQTFYNGSLTFARATPITLQAGQEVANLVLTTNRVTPRRLAGNLSIAIRGGGQRKLHLSSETAPRVHLPVDAGGNFSAEGLLPAKYRIEVSNESVTVWSQVDLTNGDVTGLVIEPEPTFEVPLSVRVEGGTASGGLQVYAHNVEIDNERVAFPQAGGSYQFLALTAGVYRVESHLGGPLFVKTLLLGDQPKADFLLDLRRGPPGKVEVVMSSKVAKIDGHLDRPAGSLITTVALVDEIRSRIEVVGLTAAVDHLGKFEVKSLPPGRYRLFAIEGFDENLWGSLELTAALRDKSVAIELHEGEMKSLGISVITSEEWIAALRKVGM